MSSSQSDGTKLTDEAQILLLSEVADMVASRRSLSNGLKLFENDSRAALGGAAKSIRENLEAGQTLPEAFGGITGRYSTAIQSTLRVVVATRSSELIYMLVALIRENSAERKQARLAAIGPFLQALISAVILFFVLPFVIESMASADLISADGYPLIARISEWLVIHRTAAAFAGLGLILILCGAFVRLAKHVTWKGQHYKNYAIFSRWLAAQLQMPSGHLEKPEISQAFGQPDLGTTIITAAEVAGLSEQWFECLERIREGYTALEELRIPEGCPGGVSQCVVELAKGTRAKDSIATDLRGVSELYQRRANHHGRLTLQVIPQIASWGLMVFMMVMMLQAIILPLMEMLGGIVK